MVIRNETYAQVQADGGVPVSNVNEFYLDIGRGVAEGYSSVFKFARSSLVTSTESVIWDGGGNYPFILAEETFSIVSDDANDNGTGSGARTLYIEGLDVDYNILVEVVTLTGLTPVITNGEFLRIYRMFILTSGSNDPLNDANEGTITATGVDSSSVLAIILPNNGQTLMSPYTVPAGKTAFIIGISASCGQGKQVLLKGKFRNSPAPVGAFSIKFTLDLYEGAFYGQAPSTLGVPEKTDVVFTGQTTSGTVDASVSLEMILKDN